ncbi:MAG: GTP-binding protein [Tissierellia bacterium]|nr:GTP-binding protein [Tissierellia bacterium]
MKIVVVSGPPSSGKTSVILHLAKSFKDKSLTTSVAKFDCLSTEDDLLYKKHGIPVMKGVSGPLCPDHFFVSNIEEVLTWGKSTNTDILITESAGLCNRCSPYIKGIPGICVIDNLSGVNTPKKIGPLLKSADIVVITKGDIVSQGEREVFLWQTSLVNPGASILNINGLTGQGAFELCSILEPMLIDIDSLSGYELRFPMPMALCSYCLGETRIGEEYQKGNVKKIDMGGSL